MRITRRGFLKLGLMGAAGLALPVGSLGVAGARLGVADAIASPRVEPFGVPLPVPPVLKPARTDKTTDYYEITQKKDTAEILPGLETEIWGYEGIFPGPTVEARRGRRVVIRQTNELAVPVSTHLHGGRTPPESDGYPTDLILPTKAENGSSSAHSGPGSMGENSHGSKDYIYPNEQRGATLWYHDHSMDFTGPQVYKGLAGMYILRDEVEDSLPLPKGEKEVPLVICDRTFEEDGSFFYPSLDPSLEGEPGVLASYHTGMFGDTILVNGAPWPFMEVSNTRYRFRILNASNARRYVLALDPSPSGKPFVQVGSDGGLLDAPVSHQRIPISPAERFDVVVDFSRYPVGTKVELKNLEEDGDDPASRVMRFDVVREEKDESVVPEKLAPALDFPDLKEAEVTRELRFSSSLIGMWSINGKPFDPGRMDARPRLGSTEVWELTSNADHPIHLHLVHFRVISRGGKKPLPQDAGWKDTVYVPSGETVRVLARFDGYRGRYVFHCHNLEHEDMMMMANFEVV